MAAVINECLDFPTIKPHLLEGLPAGYTVRSLQATDYEGIVAVLSDLTVVGEFSREDFEKRVEFLNRRPGNTFVIVVVNEKQRIVGTGCLLVERKIIHKLGSVGHIEDIAVAKNQQGKKLGLHIIHILKDFAEELGCYKAILDCPEATEGFYIKCEFKRAGLEMAWYNPKL